MVALALPVLAVVHLLTPAAVAAQDRADGAREGQALSAAVSVEPGATCLNSGVLVDEISRWRESDRVAESLAIEVVGSPTSDRTAQFWVRRGDATVAERRFEPGPEKCSDLHAAVGLAIALALKALQPEPPPAASTGTRLLRNRIFAGASLGGAVVPGVNFGLGLGLRREIAAHFAVRLGAQGVAGPYGKFRGDEGRFETWLVVGRLDLCAGAVALRRLQLSACLGAAAGMLYARGEAFPTAQQPSTPYVGLASAFEVDVALRGRWSLAIAADVWVPLRRTRFVVRDEAGAILEARDLAPAGALLFVGPAYRF